MRSCFLLASSSVERQCSVASLLPTSSTDSAVILLHCYFSFFLQKHKQILYISFLLQSVPISRTSLIFQDVRIFSTLLFEEFWPMLLKTQLTVVVPRRPLWTSNPPPLLPPTRSCLRTTFPQILNPFVSTSHLLHMALIFLQVAPKKCLTSNWFWR